jgi:pimeloyl-ACP methyl ester carboxylesterase
MNHGWNEFELNGVPQWVSIRGDRSAPTLVFLHGGPGGAEYGPRRHYLSALEETWCVVDWDQRGAGRSFHGDESPSNLSIDVLVADGLALIDRLRDEAPDRPIVVVGHSFGTVLGLMIADQAADRVDAYVGASQVVNWALQERRSYDWVLAEAEKKGNAKATTALRAIGAPEGGSYPGGTESVEVQRRWLGALGGVASNPRFLTRWTMTILLAREYPIGAKVRFTKGMARSMDIIWPELVERVDFLRDVKALRVPIYLFAGDRDRITDLDQIRGWFDLLETPVKRLEVVEGVGHLNLFEAPEAFVDFMSEVRASVTSSSSARTS